jgi:hypothetical protein
MTAPVFEPHGLRSRTMSKKKSQSYGNIFQEWQIITEACTTNQGDLQHLGEQKAHLETLLERARATAKLQAVYTASRQDMSQKLIEMVEQGRRVATFLRAGIKEKYGNRNEKLVEFGVRPLRPRRQTAPPPPPPGPEAPAPDSQN